MIRKAIRKGSSLYARILKSFRSGNELPDGHVRLKDLKPMNTEMIHACRTEHGGFTRAQVEFLNVEWPATYPEMYRHMLGRIISKKDYVELHRLRNVTAGNTRGGNERDEPKIPTSFPNPEGLVKPTQSIKTYPIDLETSGGKNYENRIIQFASTIIDEDGSNTASIDDNLNQITINPECVINYWSTKANGITNKETNDKPVFSQVIDDIMIIVPYGGTVVSHSAEYNIRMLFLECVRLDDPKYMKWLESIQSIDTMKISRDLWKSEKRHSLDALCLRMGIPARHKRSSAGQDARIIALLWNKMKSGADHGEFPY